MTIPDLIRSLLGGESCDAKALEAALHEILEGRADPVPVAGLLIALAARPVEARAVAAAAHVLRTHGTAIRPNVRPLVDTCGTGGDGAGTFNISTATAFVVAAAGAAVAKHGNRGVSSKVGSADVLEEAGAALELRPAAAERLMDATGFAFLFAPTFHPAVRHVAPVRKALGVRTIFNLLGPLANPARAEFQLLGVYAPELTQVMAEALRGLGSAGALVVHCEGLDEIGLHAPTVGHRLRDGAVEPFRLDPSELGIATAPISALAGGDRSESARTLRAVLDGEPGPRADVVALNAAAALLVCGRAEDLRDGLDQARAHLASGAGRRVLERYVESSRRAARAAGGEAAR